MDLLYVIGALIALAFIGWIISESRRSHKEIRDNLRTLSCRIDSREAKFVCCHKCGVKLLKSKSKTVERFRQGEIPTQENPIYYCQLHTPKYDKCVYDFIIIKEKRREALEKGGNSNFDVELTLVETYYCSRNPWEEVDVNGKPIKIKKGVKK